MQEQWLTTTELSRLLGIARRRLYAAHKRGALRRAGAVQQWNGNTLWPMSGLEAVRKYFAAMDQK